MKLNGDKSWRAELSLPRPGARGGVIIVRGPSRPTRMAAEEDGEKMQSAAETGGMTGARQMQRKLNGETIYDSKIRS